MGDGRWQSRPGSLPKIEQLFADGNHLNIGNADMDYPAPSPYPLGPYAGRNRFSMGSQLGKPFGPGMSSAQGEALSFKVAA
jgi:hypothetical protein